MGRGQGGLRTKRLRSRPATSASEPVDLRQAARSGRRLTVDPFGRVDTKKAFRCRIALRMAFCLVSDADAKSLKLGDALTDEMLLALGDGEHMVQSRAVAEVYGIVRYISDLGYVDVAVGGDSDE